MIVSLFCLNFLSNESLWTLIAKKKKQQQQRKGEVIILRSKDPKD